MLRPKDPILPDFETAQQRQDYITTYADYFTVVYRENRANTRSEHPTLAEAEATAQVMADQIKKLVMIYAVLGPYDTWVKNIKPKEV